MLFLKELRERGDNIPFIVFTGRGREEIAIEALNLGADYYLNKIGHPQTVYGELEHAIFNTVKARKAEKRLQESEEKYRNLVENSKDLIVIVDFKGNIKFANKASEEITGYRLEDGIKNIREITPKKLWPKSLQMLLKARMGKPVPYFEYEIRRKDGKIIKVETGGQAIFKEEKPIGIQIITRNITKKRIAEEKLRESEEQLRSTFDAAVDGIAYVDPSGKILAANKRLVEEILGYKMKDTIGKNFIELGRIVPEELPHVMEAMAEVLTTGKVL